LNGIVVGIGIAAAASNGENCRYNNKC
jgi:hypothetical protein